MKMEEDSKKISMASLNLFPACMFGDVTGTSNSSPKKGTQQNISPTSRSYNDTSNVAQMGTIRQVSTLSSEYMRIKYFLELSLPEYRIYDDVKIWDMRNPESVAEYQAASHELLDIESWVSVNDMGSDIPANQSNKCELSAPLQPMKFTTGFIIMENPSPKGVKQYILCKVAVGKSYIIEKEEDGQKKIPLGYNSYYLRPSSSTTTNTSTDPSIPPPLPPLEDGNDLSQYYHEYVIHDSHQVLPLFLVQFNYISLQSLTQLPCHLCEKATAIFTCQSCDALLCSDCDNEVHKANKLVKKHKRQIIQESLSKHWKEENHATIYQLMKQLGESFKGSKSCQQHKDVEAEYYCPQCSMPVCVHCKMVGDHSSGAFSSHRLISITEAYNQCLQEGEVENPLLNEKTQAIEEKITKINQRLQEVDINYKQVEEQVHEETRKTLELLHSIHSMKAMALTSEKLELQRELNEISWIEKYLKQQRQCSAPVDYLRIWQQHKAMRQEIISFSYMHNLNANEQVKPDIHLCGNLEIRTGEQVYKEKNDDNQIISKNERKLKLLSINKIPQKDMLADILSPRSQSLIQQIKDDVNRGVLATKDEPSEKEPIGFDRARAVSTLHGFPTKKIQHQRQKTEKLWMKTLESEIKQQ